MRVTDRFLSRGFRCVLMVCAVFVFPFMVFPEISTAQEHNTAVLVHMRTSNRFVPVTGAEVTLTGSGRSETRNTDGGGFVGFGLLPVGTYDLTIRSKGIDFERSGFDISEDSVIASAYVFRGSNAPDFWDELYPTKGACRAAHPEWNCRSTTALGEVQYYRSELLEVDSSSEPDDTGDSNWSPSPAPATHSAQYVSMEVPDTMSAGQIYNVSVTMKNTGTISWSEGEEFRLGSQNPQDNQTWRDGRVNLPPPVTVAPGQSYTFSFGVTAPQAAGDYNFSWKMLQEKVRWFGDVTPLKTIRVEAVDRSVTGVIDGIYAENGQRFLGGWACAKTSNSPIDIHMYLGSPSPTGTGFNLGPANVASDPAVAAACNASGAAYRFKINLEPYLAAHGRKAIYIHGISPFGQPDLLIGRSGELKVPSGVDRSVTGWIDGVFDKDGGKVLRGWACAKTSNDPITMHMYLGGPAGAGVGFNLGPTNRPSEPAVASVCGAAGTMYRFRIDLEPYRNQYGGKAIYIHGISPFGLPHLLIGNSGALTVPPVSKSTAGAFCDQPEDGFIPGHDAGYRAAGGGILGNVEGVIQEAGKSYLVGWACKTFRDYPIPVHVYLGGFAGGGGTLVAGAAEPDMFAVGDAPIIQSVCGVRQETRFRYKIDVTSLISPENLGKRFYVHGIDRHGETNNYLIGGSGRCVVR